MVDRLAWSTNRGTSCSGTPPFSRRDPPSRRKSWTCSLVSLLSGEQTGLSGGRSPPFDHQRQRRHAEQREESHRNRAGAVDQDELDLLTRRDGKHHPLPEQGVVGAQAMDAGLDVLRARASNEERMRWGVIEPNVDLALPDVRRVGATERHSRAGWRWDGRNRTGWLFHRCAIPGLFYGQRPVSHRLMYIDITIHRR